MYIPAINIVRLPTTLVPDMQSALHSSVIQTNTDSHHQSWCVAVIHYTNTFSCYGSIGTCARDSNITSTKMSVLNKFHLLNQDSLEQFLSRQKNQ